MATDRFGNRGQQFSADVVQGSGGAPDLNYPKVKMVVGGAGVFNDWADLPPGSWIAEGNDALRTDASKFGGNLDIDIGTEDVIEQGGTMDETLVGTPALVYVKSDSVEDMAFAGTLTFGDDATEDEVIVIGGKTYTLRDILTDVDGYVKREAAATDTLDNLIAAINLGAGAGTAYAASMTAPATGVSAVAGGGDTLTLYCLSALVTTTTVLTGWGAANAVAGTGAATTTIYGLSASGALQSETIGNTGVTLAPSASTYSFVHRALIASAGSGGVNAGIIQIVNAADDDHYLYIAAGNGQTLFAAYMVATDHELYVLDIHFALGASPPSGADVVCTMQAKPSGGAYNLKYQAGLVTGGTTSVEHVFRIGMKFIAGTILKLTATTDTNNTPVYAGWDGYLKDVS